MKDERQFADIAEIAADHPLLAAVWEQFPMAMQEPLSITVDTRSFSEDQQKLGIGSSAAAVVALSAAFGAVSGRLDDDGKRAHAAHLALQNGRGSGADIASSIHGGVIIYRMHECSSARLGWPKGLHYALLWSGRATSTATQLQKLDGVGASDVAATLAAAAQDVANAWESDAAQPIMVAMRDYASALRRYDDEHQLGIFASGHAALAEAAAKTGLVYKPCGAGGGDFGIAVAEDPQELQQFVIAAKDEGFVHADMEIDPIGVRIEQGEQ